MGVTWIVSVARIHKVFTLWDSAIVKRLSRHPTRNLPPDKFFAIMVSGKYGLCKRSGPQIVMERDVQIRKVVRFHKFKFENVTDETDAQ